jgi:hypothetical protein
MAEGRTNGAKLCKRLWVLKKSVIGTCFLAGSVAGDKFSFLTSAKR